MTDDIGNGRFIVADPRMMQWVAARIPSIEPGYAWPQGAAIGLASGNEIIAGMVVHDYVPRARACQITFAAASPRWATRASIAAMLRYPFVQLDCRRISAMIAASNTRSARLAEGLGFRHEGVARLGFGEEDAWLYGLLREELPAWVELERPLR